MVQTDTIKRYVPIDIRVWWYLSGKETAMKIYNNTNITYSAIEHNSRKNTKQNVPADLEKKMTQYTDTLSISKTGQEIFKHLSSVSFMDYVNRFENEVTEVLKLINGGK